MQQLPYKTLFKRSPLTVVLAALLFAAGCANVVAPTGGPRDTDPPEVVRSTPPNFSTNFRGGEIRIFFDEFVQLQNIRQQLLVSPPLEETPEVSIRGRSIVMDIEEELRENTTYNIFFGDAIRDITEGNAIPNFQFVFSTGDYVDSLALGGRVKNAFNHSAEEGVYVMLYDNVYDSVPYLERPVYLAKTDSEGRFAITNMAEGSYLMFALDDNNNNFKYDLPDERIAFIDSLVSPEYIPAVAEEEPNDTIEPSQGDLPPPSAPLEYILYMFQERDTVQRIVSSELVKAGLIRVEFRQPFDSAHVRDIRHPGEERRYIPEYSAGRDTLNIWFADTGRDSLFLEVLDRDVVLDTIMRPTRPRRTRSQPDEETQPSLELRMGFRNARAVPYFRPLVIRSENPVEELDPDKISLLIHDSIPLETGFDFKDRARRNLEISPPLEEGTTYFLEILPGTFTDIFGLINDTIQSRFTTTTADQYGNIIVDLQLPHDDRQYILQLLDRDQKVSQQLIIEEAGRYTFRHLAPRTYSLRLIEDINKSGRWDTGNYLRGIQPEQVYMYEEEIQIRENWDAEIPWMPGDNFP